MHRARELLHSHHAKSAAMLCYSPTEIVRNVESRDRFSNNGKGEERRKDTILANNLTVV